MADRETGTVKKWNEKGFGFIERDGMGDSIFVHASDTANRHVLVPGSKVSFIYETDEKSGKAREVTVEEMGEHTVSDEGPREMGTVIRWNGEKGFGFIRRANGEADAFFHKKSFDGYNEPFFGQAVSFVFEEGPKGPAATKVKEEEGSIAIGEAPFEDEREREMGTVKRWNAEKGFGFIGRVSGEKDAFFHQKSFSGSNEPYVGQAVSFILEEGPQGAAAVQVKEEEGGVPGEEEEEGEREMGKVKTYNEEEGFVFTARCFDATEVLGHKREFLHDTEPYVGQPVSFLYEVTEKGGEAKKNTVFQISHSQMKAVNSGPSRLSTPRRASALSLHARVAKRYDFSTTLLTM